MTRRLWWVGLLAAGCGGGSAGTVDGGQVDAAVSADAGGPDAAPLSNPGPGEWPMFKRDLAHTGLAPGRGGITAATLCEKWPARTVTVADTRGASGALIATLDGIPTILVAVQGCPGRTNFACSSPPGKVVALRGSDGAERWTYNLPAGVEADPYAPLVADIDGDGYRELVTPSSNTNQVFVVRAEAEPGGAAGTLQWAYQAVDTCARSETAPVALDLDGDPGLEIGLGTDVDLCVDGVKPKFYAFDGARAETQEGAPFEGLIRPQTTCPGGRKMDSSSPAVATVDGKPTLFVGSWDGHLYALQFEAGRLVRKWDAPLPPSAQSCPIRKVRAGPVVADIVPGGPLEVAFPYMEDAGPNDDFTTGRLRILSASGLTEVGDVHVCAWKSSPSVADLDGNPQNGLEIVGGDCTGYYMVRQTTPGVFAPAYDKVYGGVGNNGAGNRSSPAIADIDGAAATGGDPALEVIMGIEGTSNPGVIAFAGTTGDIKWSHPVPGGGVTAAVAIGNLDSDSNLELVFFAFDGKVHALDDRCP